MLINELQNLGLSDKEAKVYLALMELGPSSAFEISKRTGIHHSTVYLEMNSLLDKNLVSKYINDLIDSKKEQLTKEERILNTLLPELSNLYMSSMEKTKIKIYEGEEGVKQIEDDADIELNQMGEHTCYSFTPLDLLDEIDPKDNVAKRRIGRQEKLKMIYTHADGIQKYNNPKKFREARFLSRSKYPFNSLVVIIPDHSVRIFSFIGGFVGFWIFNKDFANTLKMMWDVFWEIAEEEK